MSIITPIPVDKSVVFGYVFDNGVAVVGAEVTFKAPPFMLNDNLVVIDETATTDVDGRYQANLAQTIDTGTIVDISIEFTNARGDDEIRKESLVVSTVDPASVQSSRAVGVPAAIITGGAQGQTGLQGIQGPQGLPGNAQNVTNLSRSVDGAFITLDGITPGEEAAIYLVDPDTGDVEITIPNAGSSPSASWSFYKEITDANSVLIATVGGVQLIGGETTQTILQKTAGFQILEDGTRYVITTDTRSAFPHAHHSRSGDGATLNINLPTLIANPDTGDITATLPNPADMPDAIYILKNEGSGGNDLIINSIAGELIDGAATQTITDGDSIMVYSLADTDEYKIIQDSRILYGSPVTVGTANADGSASTHAHSDHVHDHGSQTDPTLHAAAIDGGNAGFITGSDQNKLNNIEALADVTDTTNVNAAGATMNADTTLVGNGYFLDEDNMLSDDDTKTASQQSIKAYVDTTVASVKAYKGGYNAATNTPDLDVSPSASIDSGYVYDVTAAGTFFTELVEIGDTLIATQAAPTLLTHWVVTQSNLTAASIKTQYESNADTNAFTDSQVTDVSDSVTHNSSDGTDHSNVVLNDTHRASDGTDHSNVVLNDTHRASNGTDHANVVLNDTHRASSGTDHANVVLNDTHRASNGTDHANVVLNDTHRASDGTDHANVVLNDTHRASDGTDHANVVLNDTHRADVTGNPHFTTDIVFASYLPGTTSDDTASALAVSAATAETIAEMTLTFTPALADNEIDVFFSGTFGESTTAKDATIHIGVFVGGVLEAETQRSGTCKNTTDLDKLVTLATFWKGALAVASQTVDIRTWTTAGGGATVVAVGTRRSMHIKEVDE